MSEYSFWLDALLDAPCSPPATQLEYSWSLTDHSNNIYIKKEDMLTLHRQREIETTDACRGAGVLAEVFMCGKLLGLVISAVQMRLSVLLQKMLRSIA